MFSPSEIFVNVERFVQSFFKIVKVKSKIVCRLSGPYFKEASSKIEETVERLKEKEKQKIIDSTVDAKLAESATASSVDDPVDTGVVTPKPVEKPPSPPPEPAPAPPAAAAPVAVEPKKSLWVRFKDEVNHYYSGFKLLFLDVKVSSKIVWKILRGKTLTRRESRQLVRTTSVSQIK